MSKKYVVKNKKKRFKCGRTLPSLSLRAQYAHVVWNVLHLYICNFLWFLRQITIRGISNKQYGAWKNMWLLGSFNASFDRGNENNLFPRVGREPITVAFTFRSFAAAQRLPLSFDGNRRNRRNFNLKFNKNIFLR